MINVFTENIVIFRYSYFRMLKRKSSSGKSSFDDKCKTIKSLHKIGNATRMYERLTARRSRQTNVRITSRVEQNSLRWKNKLNNSFKKNPLIDYANLNDIGSVSYTHLDVYKRQGLYS